MSEINYQITDNNSIVSEDNSLNSENNPIIIENNSLTTEINYLTREAQCIYFGKCAGCSLQHIKYPIQLENKKKILQNLLKFQNIETINSAEFNYRNKLELLFHQRGIGLRSKEKKIINIERCKIADLKINQLITEIKAYFKNVDSFDYHKKSGTFRFAVIRCTAKSSSISFALNSKSQRLQDAISQINQFKTSADNILITYILPEIDETTSEDFIVIKGTDVLCEQILNKTFYFSAQGFFQNNTTVAKLLHEKVNTILKTYNTKGTHLLDLFAGVGSFGIVNAELFSEISIIESYKPCIDAANRNIKENNLSNIKTYCMDANKLKKINFPQKLFVILDPPRTGMDEKTIISLKELKPEALIYISCNPYQLAKDIKKFKKYQLKSAILCDMFPQTRHIETIAELVRI